MTDMPLHSDGTSGEVSKTVEERRRPRTDYLPRVRQLYRKHFGLTKSLSQAYEEAVCVCLDGGDSPTRFDVENGETVASRLLLWETPTERERRAWANTIDRVEAAAYGVAIAAIEIELGLVAIGRAHTLSGADYYLAPANGGDYLENAYRLEVSGTTSSEGRRIHERMRQKLQQVARPSNPSLACVVSFGAPAILIETI
jgi:hypothetical protein